MAHYLKQYENAMKTYTCGRGLNHSFLIMQSLYNDMHFTLLLC